MNTTNIGLIATGSIAGDTQLSLASVQNGYQLRKVLVNESLPAGLAGARYPGVEQVEALAAILDDANIQLVVLAGDAGSDLQLIRRISESGKFLRIIQHPVAL